MQINWALITCLVIGFFALAGLTRGWWKEAITTAFLAVLVFLLQQPDLAQSLINGFNSLLSTVWGLLPTTLQTFISDTLETFLGISLGGAAPQANASDPSTWIVILLVVVGISILMGRYSFNNRPDPLGAFLGLLVGGLNGFLVLNLAREYLDGRALPGSTSYSTEITMTGANAFAAASQTIAIQATNLPTWTILDSTIPWMLIVAGVLLAIFVVATRYVFYERNKAGDVRIYNKKLPPFYRTTPPPKPTELNTLVKDIKKIFNEG